jgi:hypothetical protein
VALRGASATQRWSSWRGSRRRSGSRCATSSTTTNRALRRPFAGTLHFFKWSRPLVALCVLLSPVGAVGQYRVYVGNSARFLGQSPSLSILEAGNPFSLGESPAPEHPRALAVLPDGTRLYSIGDDLVVRNPLTRTTIDSLPITGTDLAISPNGRALYVMAWDQLHVVNTDPLSVLSSYDVGGGGFSRVAPSPNGSTLYVAPARGDRVIQVNLAKGTIRYTPVRDGNLAALAVAPDGSFLYALANRIYVVDTATNALVKTIPIDDLLSPSDLAIAPNGRFAYVTVPCGNSGRCDQGSIRVVPIDTVQHRVTGAVGGLSSGGTYPCNESVRVAIAPTSTQAYVTDPCTAPGAVHVVDAAVPASGQFTKTIYVGDDPGALAIGVAAAGAATPTSTSTPTRTATSVIRTATATPSQTPTITTAAATPEDAIDATGDWTFNAAGQHCSSEITQTRQVLIARVSCGGTVLDLNGWIDLITGYFQTGPGICAAKGFVERPTNVQPRMTLTGSLTCPSLSGSLDGIQDLASGVSPTPSRTPTRPVLTATVSATPTPSATASPTVPATRTPTITPVTTPPAGAIDAAGRWALTIGGMACEAEVTQNLQTLAISGTCPLFAFEMQGSIDLLTGAFQAVGTTTGCSPLSADGTVAPSGSILVGGVVCPSFAGALTGSRQASATPSPAPTSTAPIPTSSPSATSPPAETATATASPTSTGSATGTVTAATPTTPVVVVVGGSGHPGESVSMTMALDADSALEAVGLDAEIRFDAAVTHPLQPLHDHCTLDARLAATHGLGTQLLADDVLLVSIYVTGVPAILPALGNGPMVSCDFGIAPTATGGPTTLILQAVALTDGEALPLTASVHNGTIIVLAPSPTPTDIAPSPSPTSAWTAPPQSPTISPTPFVECAGDCDRDGLVTVAELIEGVRMSLGMLSVEHCAALDRDGNASVTVDELVVAVRAALSSCAG